MKPLAKFILKRSVISVSLLLAVLFFTFIALNTIPGDPTFIILGQAGWTPEAAHELREELGLNDPLYVQFARYTWNALQGDLGKSYLTRTRVFPEVWKAYGASLQLGVLAMTITLALSIPWGIIAAVRRNSLLDRLSRIFTVSLSSIPIFVLGILYMYVFSVELRLLPSTGRGGVQHIILPAVTLASFAMAGMLRMTRASMLDVLRQDYVRAAKAKGLKTSSVIYGHALRNALNPIVTLAGLLTGVMIGGAIITEYVFAWPGIGSFTISAILERDFPMIQAGILFISATYIFASLIVDILYAYLDPRIRIG